MEKNQFTESQLIFLYNNPKFIDFISSYFSSYGTASTLLFAGVSAENQDINWKIYIRILLANISVITEALERMEKSISFSYEERRIISAGGIKGRLLVDEYVKNKTMVRMPKEYSCVVKEKSHKTPENEYICFILNSIIERLIDLLNRMDSYSTGIESEVKLLQNYLDYFISLQNKFPFNSFSTEKKYRSTFSRDKLNLIYTRLVKGKIKNAYSYERIFAWYDKFITSGFVWIDRENIKMLIYDEQFSNKLFEIWCLYKIIAKFQSDFEMSMVDKNELKVGLTNYVCRLKSIDGNYVEIYYQKGSGLYWDEQYNNNWRYVNSSKYLNGIPDISVKYIGDEENLTLIDLKNRVRKGGDNSEEIYKVIGYFANFNSYLNSKYNTKHKNQAVLIFRNDRQSFHEELESETNESILALSVGVKESEELCENQFKEICRYILDMQGISGTKSETISDCNKNIDDYYNDLNTALQNNDDTVDDIMYQIESSNHAIISNMFSTGELKTVLEQKKRQLKEDHFPHIWDYISNDTIETLAMAECLFKGLMECDGADYAPICLEYCRALEIQLNELIFTPFKNTHDVTRLAHKNRNYKKLNNDRDLTLGECIYILRKCKASAYATTELYDFVKNNVACYDDFLDIGLNFLEGINIDVRRKAAHTTLMSYNELLNARQRIMGIGNINLLYILLDKR
ncbi:MAG: hypothetical protein ACLRVU_00880 [Beduini sp.]|uniref:hypothetical protein n=1 Tax=Beduini sp. TaxID=1922300 RepID=UPI0039A124C5